MTTETMQLSSSRLYNYLHQQYEEIQKHKWIESEKAGRDIGYDKALLDWLKNHKKNWKYKE